MEYSDDQYRIMKLLSEGYVWEDPEEYVKEIIWFLESEGIARSRVDIQDNFWTLTEKGKACLAKKQLREEQLNKVADEATKEERNKRKEKMSDRKFQIALALINSFLSFAAGMLLEHFSGIISFFRSLWSCLFG